MHVSLSLRITAAPPDMSVDELCLRAPVLLALVKQADALADHFDDENENEDWKACLVRDIIDGM